ncbi:hypothetical protein C8F01DRAFT_1125390 [Mycena amicta]|nr:hypothetical protein C8F01DRAFT_1125390 [Mycena amicta]
MTSTSPYSLFFTSGLHAPALYSHDIDDDIQAENEPQSPVKTALRSPGPRKRRSSITTATSPVSVIKLKSPARAAGNAWHIANVAAHSPRSRSGSVNVASEDSSMIGRMRSGSLTNRLRSRRPLTSKRPVALLFTPTQPAPTAPLPALPLSAPARPPLSRLTIHPQPILPSPDVFYSAPAGSPTPSSASAWMGFGVIEEEMRDD